MRDDEPVRTTLDIDDDVLRAVRELASNRSTTAGRVISALARKALAHERAPRPRNGVPLMPRRTRRSPRPTMLRWISLVPAAIVLETVSPVAKEPKANWLVALK